MHIPDSSGPCEPEEAGGRHREAQVDAVDHPAPEGIIRNSMLYYYIMLCYVMLYYIILYSIMIYYAYIIYIYIYIYLSFSLSLYIYIHTYVHI